MNERLPDLGDLYKDRIDKMVDHALQNGKPEREYLPIEDYPENMLMVPNIRPFSPEHIVELAESIESNGQIQECPADLVMVEEEGILVQRIRVIGGKHRKLAVETINANLKKKEAAPDKLRKLRVHVFQGTYTDEEVLMVQLEENLQNQMRAEEKAGTIAELYELYLRSSQKEKSIASFARKIGHGESEVRDAINYSNLLEERIKQLVTKGVLTYSIGVQLARIPKLDEQNILTEGEALAKSKQFSLAAEIIQHNLSMNRLRERITTILGTQPELPGLFSLEMIEALEKEAYTITYKNTAAREALAAAAFFKRIEALLEVPGIDRKEISDPIREIWISHIKIAVSSFDRIREQAPELADEIMREVLRS